MTSQASRSQQPCKWFAIGKCKFGDECRNSHDPAKVVPRSRSRSGSSGRTSDHRGGGNRGGGDRGANGTRRRPNNNRGTGGGGADGRAADGGGRAPSPNPGGEPAAAPPSPPPAESAAPTAADFPPDPAIIMPTSTVPPTLSNEIKPTFASKLVQGMPQNLPVRTASAPPTEHQNAQRQRLYVPSKTKFGAEAAKGAPPLGGASEPDPSASADAETASAAAAKADAGPTGDENLVCRPVTVSTAAPTNESGPPQPRQGRERGSASRSASKSGAQKYCRFFQQGPSVCRNGDNCRFRHEIMPAGSDQAAATTTAAADVVANTTAGKGLTAQSGRSKHGNNAKPGAGPWTGAHGKAHQVQDSPTATTNGLDRAGVPSKLPLNDTTTAPPQPTQPTRQQQTLPVSQEPQPQQLPQDDGVAPASATSATSSAPALAAAGTSMTTSAPPSAAAPTPATGGADGSAQGTAPAAAAAAAAAPSPLHQQQQPPPQQLQMMPPLGFPPSMPPLGAMSMVPPQMHQQAASPGMSLQPFPLPSPMSSGAGMAVPPQMPAGALIMPLPNPPSQPPQQPGAPQTHVLPAQIPGPPPPFIHLNPGTPVFSIDVECVATGRQHYDRCIAQIGMVDMFCRPCFNIIVKPSKPVVSYITPLTGLTKEKIDMHGIPEEEALAWVRRTLPPNSVLVGMNILKDVEWLGLEQGKDFQDMVDLSALFRVWNVEKNSFTYFGLDHVSYTWLDVLRGGANGGAHDAMQDAFASMALFNTYCQVQHTPQLLYQLQMRTLHTPIAPSFAKQHPTWEDCCMGNRRTCKCGAPFLS